MPDISMCNGQGCPIKDQCYRHTATPDPYCQCWFDPPYDHEKGECAWIMPPFNKSMTLSLNDREDSPTEASKPKTVSNIGSNKNGR